MRSILFVQTAAQVLNRQKCQGAKAPSLIHPLIPVTMDAGVFHVFHLKNLTLISQ